MISQEDRTKQISDLYRIALRREPDEGGLQYYVNSGLPIDQIEDILYGSDEFKDLRVLAVFPPLYYMQRKNNNQWPIHWVSTRDLAKVVAAHGQDLVGCEVGTHNGWGLVWLLQHASNIAKVYAIDPFAPYDDTVTGGILMTEKSINAAKENWFLNTEPYKDRVELIQKSSMDAASDIADGSLDFIFIDGNHSYDFVKQDVNTYYSKVKSGGIFSGHDWKAAKNSDVERAVYEFMDENNIDRNQLKVCAEDVWYWIKN